MAREITEFVTPADLDAIPDGTTYKKMSATEQTKLTGIEDNATADQTGLEMQTAIVGLADADRVLVGSEPQSGEKKIYGIHVNASGNLEADNDDTAES
jgi:hypothetical protein